MDDTEEVEEDVEEIIEEPVEEVPVEEEPVEEEPVEETPTVEDDEGLPRKTVTEGEVVNFPNLQATDPDGDPITYSFTTPLDSTGKWLTHVGDAGEYRVTITASDGKNSVSQVVIVEVLPKNKPPVIRLAAKEITVKEGEKVTLAPEVTDADGDEVTLTFSGWMTTASYQTNFADAGTHEVVLKATDGITTTTETVRVIVQNKNRAPTISPIADVNIKEGDKITIDPTANDPDGDDVTFEFGPPISPDGTWQTGLDDVGKYQVDVVATDGDLTATASFMLVVESLNKPPVINMASLVNVEEGQTVTLAPEITDPEGDELTITYSGWMNTHTYTTTYEDAGSHEVTIKVSDGINEAEKTVTIVVTDLNRPPTFGSGAFI